MIFYRLSQAKSTIVAVVALFAITSVIFGFSFKYRNVTFETFQKEGEAGYITLMRAKNWYSEGPASLKFALYNEIKTVENENVFTKDNLYSSFLPGQVIPVYLVSRLLHQAPTVLLLVVINLITFFLTALILALISFFFLRQLKFKSTVAFVFSLIPICLYVFLPGPFALYHISYSSEHLSILPFALFILMEVIIDGTSNERRRKLLKLFQGVILFGGIVVSWFLVFVALVVYFKRIVLLQITKFFEGSFYFWLPIIVGIMLFLGQQFVIFSELDHSSGADALKSIWDMFLRRAGLNDVGTPQYIQAVIDQAKLTSPLAIEIVKPFAFTYYFYGYFISLYGVIGFWLAIVTFFSTIATIVYALMKKIQKKTFLNADTVKTVSLICLIMFPALIWTAIFRQQVSWHDIELLKVGLFVALGPFVLFPVLLYLIFRQKMELIMSGRSRQRLQLSFFVILFALLLSYIFYTVFNTPPLFHKPPPLRYEIQKFILTNTAFDDIVFTTIYVDPKTMKAGNYDVTLIAPTNKRIYEIRTVKDVYLTLRNVGAQYTINVLTLNSDEKSMSTKFQKLLSTLPYEKISNNRLTLYKINKTDFLSLNKDWFDDLNELVMNGDFDTSIMGWSTWPKATLETAPDGSSDKALKIRLDSISSSGVYQAVSVTPGKMYQLSFYQKNGNSNSTYCFGSTLAGQEVKACEDVGNVYWTKYTHTFIAPGNKVYLQFHTRFSNAAGDYSYIDEVSLRESGLQ